MMQRVTRDKITYVFDRRLEPVARVKGGEIFVVETEDSRGGRTRTPETCKPEYLLAMRKRGYHGNPVTGPIYVEGAMPGDTLVVHILEQECDTLGYQGYWPFLFHLEDFFDLPSTVLREIRDGKIVFDDRTQIPVRPCIGTIGTTPALEAVLSGGCGRHGGNLDSEEVCAGSTVYLPVFVEGALLGLGDCHALQSDGEINELEMRSVITLKCEVLKGRSPVMSWPRVETPDLLVTVAMASPLEEALRLALRDMILWMEELAEMSKHDAYLLLGLVGHARPGQVQVGPYSMRVQMPKQYLPVGKTSVCGEAREGRSEVE
ncbi:MAG: acetamidase/formamidase family protein [Acidobacteriota bacterium]